jgi:hypothetical protein
MGYGYDALNRPTAATWSPAPTPAAPTAGSVTFGHSHNKVNQRIGQTVSDNTWFNYPSATASTVSYTAYALNQYTAVGAVAPSYDGNGNLTFDGTFTFGYDAENRLASASGAVGFSGFQNESRFCRRWQYRWRCPRVRYTKRADTARRNNYDGAMMDIEPSETVLTGQWILQGGRPVADDVCKRILALANSYLVEVGRDASGWNVLYRDPNDGRYWELSYPQGELHGGGPPQLRCLTTEEARQKYGEGY